MIKSKKAESYIDVCVGIIVLLSVIVLTLNIYTFFTLKQDMDEISSQLIEVATYEGCFGDKFNERVSSLQSEFFDFSVTTEADRYFNVPYKKVQLGDVMRVTVTVNTNVQGIGVIEIPITARSTRSGISEKYWK